MSFSKDGTSLAVVEDILGGSQVRILDYPTFTPVRRMPADAAMFSPCGRWLAVIDNGRIILCDADTFSAFCVIRGRGDAALSGPCRFSRDGRFLACVLSKEDIAIIDVSTRTVLHHLDGHYSAIRDIAFLADNCTLASAGDDSRVILWDLITGQQKVILRGHSAGVNALASPGSGEFLASAGIDQTIRLWWAPRGDSSAAITQMTGEYVCERAKRYCDEKISGVIPSTSKAMPSPFVTDDPILADVIRLTDNVRARPQDSSAWKERADLFRCYRLWRRAAEDYERAIACDPADPWIHYRAAVLHLMAGDQDEYQTRRDSLLRLVETRPELDHIQSFAANAVALTTHPNTDYARLIERTTALAKANPTLFWLIYPRAGVFYRMGRYQEAREVLEAELQDRFPVRKEVICRLWLSMTYHQLGMRQEARAMLDTAMVRAQLIWPNQNDELEELVAWMYVDFCVIGREARQMIIGETPDEPWTPEISLFNEKVERILQEYKTSGE